jgi:hypothetical protein
MAAATTLPSIAIAKIALIEAMITIRGLRPGSDAG